MNVSALTKLQLRNLFPFQLDEFQYEAIAALNSGKSVVVCAPTGAGKTLIGEYAIYRALSRGGRVFYTTPLKALSNQKLRDFRKLFGYDTVGLLTGDLSMNREAPILVMTTEIFRNMLYGTAIGAVGTSLDGVEAVVLDECHYMNDRQRGTVWEESIIYCPPEIQLVGLSATIANSQQLADWISSVHGPTQLIYSEYRPVPLQYHFCLAKGLFRLLDATNSKIDSKLKALTRGKKGKDQAPSIPEVVEQLLQREMLPAIYFIFSRRGCDKAIESLEDIVLVSDSEAKKLRQRVDKFLAENPGSDRRGHLQPLLRGVAAHHAGILPTWKAFVEELFQSGLIKVVFATETLAAGINMPARTTVISSLSKRTDDGHRLLTPSEFLQMAGRAGRRGMDIVGYVVTVQTRFEGAKEASYLATKGADPLASRFSPSYGMVLNLLQTHSIEEAKELVESSFGQYLATMQLKPKIRELEEQNRQKQQLVEQLAEVDEEICKVYEKLRGRLKEEQRLLKTLEEQALETFSNTAVLTLPSTIPGTLISLKSRYLQSKQAEIAILVAQVPGSGQFPNLIALDRKNRWHVVSSRDAIAIYDLTIPDLDLDIVESSIPEELIVKPGQQRRGSEATEAIAAELPNFPSPVDLQPEVMAQKEQVAAVRSQIEKHPIHGWGDPSTLLKRKHRADKLKAEIRKKQNQVQSYLDRYWKEFLDLISILVDLEGLAIVNEDQELDSYNPGLANAESAENSDSQYLVTKLGEAVAAIRGDNELWLGLAVSSGLLEDLDPHHLATVCAALVTEVSRPNSWTRYEMSPELELTFASLQKIRRKLFQVQHRHGVGLPVWLERDLTALVEPWALGADWVELCDNTSLDEGDVVRILRRTLDFLSQIPHVPYVSRSLIANTHRAMQLIDRFPVNEAIN